MVKDLPNLGQYVFCASKAHASASSTGQHRVTAVAVREQRNSKARKVLRFMHAVPDPLPKDLDSWVAVAKSVALSKMHPYTNKTDEPGFLCQAALSNQC